MRSLPGSADAEVATLKNAASLLEEKHVAAKAEATKLQGWARRTCAVPTTASD
jgi:hypothetical protein